MPFAQRMTRNAMQSTRGLFRQNSNASEEDSGKPADEDVVEREDLLAWLSRQKGSVEYLFWMLVGIFWYCVYIYAIISETQPHDAFMMEKTLVDTFITEGTDAITYDAADQVLTGIKFKNVASSDDFWEWIEQSALSAAFPSEHDSTDYSLQYDQIGVDAPDERSRLRKELNKADTVLPSSRFMRYNKLLFGMHLSQTRAKRMPCSQKGPASARLSKLIQYCYPGTDEMKPVAMDVAKQADETTISWHSNFFGWGNAVQPKLPDTVEMEGSAAFYTGSAVPLTFTGGSTGKEFVPPPSVPDKSYTMNPPRFYNGTKVQMQVDSAGGFWLQSDASFRARQKVIDYYKQMQWIDLYTSKIEVKIYTYNGNEARVASLSMMFEYDRGGNMVPSFDSRSAIVAETDGPGNGFSWLHVVILFWATKTLLSEIWDALAFHREGQLSVYLRSIWNLFDVVCAILAIFVITQMASLKVTLAAKVDEISVISSQDEATKRLSELDELYDTGIARMRLAAFVSIILQALRVLKYFRHQPRLSVMSKTLANSANDLFHFFVLFMVLFMSWSIAGYFSFGHKVEGFSTITLTVQTMFNMLLGDFDWGALQEANETIGMIFFMSYMILIVLIALNMLLAIVMDAYTEVKDGVASDAPSLIDDSVKLIIEMPQFLHTAASTTCRDLRSSLKCLFARNASAVSPDGLKPATPPFKGPINREQTGFLVRALSDGLWASRQTLTSHDLASLGCTKPDEVLAAVQEFAVARRSKMDSYDEAAEMTKALNAKVDDLTAKLDALVSCFPDAAKRVKQMEEEKTSRVVAKRKAASSALGAPPAQGSPTLTPGGGDSNDMVEIVKPADVVEF